MRVSHSEGQLARRGDSADVGASGGKDDARVALGAGEAWRGARCGRQETLSLTCGVGWEAPTSLPQPRVWRCLWPACGASARRKDVRDLELRRWAVEAEKEPRGNETMGEGPPECSPPKASRVEVTPELAASGEQAWAPCTVRAGRPRLRGGPAGEARLRLRRFRDTLLSCWSFDNPVDSRSTSYCLTLAPECEGRALPSGRPRRGGRGSQAVRRL